MYQPPNTSEHALHQHLSEAIPRVKTEWGNKQIIIRMDHNLDLLKYNNHVPMQKFLDLLLNNKLLPTITRPMRITQQSVTLIDT